MVSSFNCVIKKCGGICGRSYWEIVGGFDFEQVV